MTTHAITELNYLQMYDVFHVGGSEPVWSGMASSRIHAMDRYVHQVDSTYSGYTAMLEDDQDHEYIYEHGGDIIGVLENTEIFARPRTGAVTGAAYAAGRTPAAPVTGAVRPAYAAPGRPRGGAVTPAAPAAPRFRVADDQLYADTPVRAIEDCETGAAVQWFPWTSLGQAKAACDSLNSAEHVWADDEGALYDDRTGLRLDGSGAAVLGQEEDSVDIKPSVYLMIAGGNGYSAITRAKPPIAKTPGFFEIVETVDAVGGQPLQPGLEPDWESAGICDHRGGGGPEGFELLRLALEAAEGNARSVGVEVEHISL